MTMYQARPAIETTTEDLIATIAADRDDVATFEARAEFSKRCGLLSVERLEWRTYAPVIPRTFVTVDGQCIMWHNFYETGVL
jgi:hypothetical protein